MDCHPEAKRGISVLAYSVGIGVAGKQPRSLASLEMIARRKLAQSERCHQLASHE
jgi:hypothetical protein